MRFNCTEVKSSRMFAAVKWIEGELKGSFETRIPRLTLPRQDLHVYHHQPKTATCIRAALAAPTPSLTVASYTQPTTMPSAMPPPESTSRGIDPPPRSPSPPVPPTSRAPGPRASALQKVFNDALTHTLRTCSYNNFAECFPTPARYVPQALDGLHRDFVGKLEEMCKVSVVWKGNEYRKRLICFVRVSGRIRGTYG